MSNDKAAATYHGPPTPPRPLNGPRRAARTAFQAFVALCLLAPVLVAETGLKADQVAWLTPVLAVAAGVSRVMALPQVENFLARFAPWLAATPTPKRGDQHD